jgi:hypothetical protein
MRQLEAFDVKADNVFAVSRAAYLISVEGQKSPAALQARIKALAIQGALSNLSSGPNALAFNGVQRGGMRRLKRSTVS